MTTVAQNIAVTTNFVALLSHDTMYPAHILAKHSEQSPILYTKGNSALLSAEYINCICTSETATNAGIDFVRKVAVNRATHAAEKPVLCASTMDASLYMAHIVLQEGGSVIVFLAEGYTDKPAGERKNGRTYAAKLTQTKCEELFAQYGYERVCVVTLINPDPLLEQKSNLFVASERNMYAAHLITHLFVGEVNGCDGTYDLVMDCINEDKGVFVLNIDPAKMQVSQNRRILYTKNQRGNVVELTSPLLATL